MNLQLVVMIILSTMCGFVYANDPVALPKGVPPVIGIAVATNDRAQTDDYERWTIHLTVPKIAWQVVGERRPKFEWPEFKVNVAEVKLTLSMGHHPSTQLSESAQNRIVDLKGSRLDRDDALKRLDAKTPVLVSVSGDMPDPFYLQCTSADTLIVILGIPDFPAPELLPQPLQMSTTPSQLQEGRTKR